MRIAQLAPPRFAASRPRPEATVPNDRVLLHRGDQLVGAACGALIAGLPAFASTIGGGSPFIGAIGGAVTGMMVGSTLGRHVWRDVGGYHNVDGAKGGWLGFGLAALGTAAGIASSGHPGAAVGAVIAGGLIGGWGLTPSFMSMQDSLPTRPLSDVFAGGATAAEARTKSLIYRSGTNKVTSEILFGAAFIAGASGLAASMFGGGWAAAGAGVGLAAGLGVCSRFAANRAERQFTEARRVNAEGVGWSEDKLEAWERLASRIHD